VVSAYYGDVNAGDYKDAYALLNHGATTGQSYQGFVSGYRCTTLLDPTENWESGDQVSFDLSDYDTCDQASQSYTGIETVQDGVITAAHITQTGGPAS
jgi:hypothetical protein